MQKSDVKVSVIIPVYNVGKFIERAIHSVLAGTLSNIELILVNDGSTDNSLEICKRYAAIDDRVMVLEQENKGAHIARNNGFKVARGTYSCFFDGDDYIEKNMLNDMYTLAVEHDSDLVVCGFNILTYYDDENFTTREYIPYTLDNSSVDVYNDRDKFRKFSYLNFDRNMFYPPWNKLFRTDYLRANNIEFPIMYRDDFPFVIETIKNISKVTFTKNVYYNFIRKRSDSETQKYYANLYSKREEEHENMLNLYKHWGLIGDKPSYEMISRRYVDRIIECIVNLYNVECTLNTSEKLIEIKKYLSTDNFDNAIKTARPRKLYLKMLYIPLILKNAILCHIMCRFINFIKKHNIKLFSNLKMNR